MPNEWEKGGGRGEGGSAGRRVSGVGGPGRGLWEGANRVQRPCTTATANGRAAIWPMGEEAGGALLQLMMCTRCMGMGAA